MKTTGIVVFGLLALCGHLVADDAQPDRAVVLPNIDVLGEPYDQPLRLVVPTTDTNAVQPSAVQVLLGDGHVVGGRATYLMSDISFASVRAAVRELFGRPADHDSVKNSVSWICATDRGTEITVNVHYQSRRIDVAFGEHPIEKEENTEPSSRPVPK